MSGGGRALAEARLFSPPFLKPGSCGLFPGGSRLEPQVASTNATTAAILRGFPVYEEHL